MPERKPEPPQDGVGPGAQAAPGTAPSLQAPGPSPSAPSAWEPGEGGSELLTQGACGLYHRACTRVDTGVVGTEPLSPDGALRAKRSAGITPKRNRSRLPAARWTPHPRGWGWGWGRAPRLAGRAARPCFRHSAPTLNTGKPRPTGDSAFASAKWAQGRRRVGGGCRGQEGGPCAPAPSLLLAE